MILFIVGLIVIVISFSSLPHNQTLINAIVDLNASSPSVSYGVSISHFLSGNSNGQINGSMLAYRQCCVDFYIFTDTAWTNFMTAGFKVSNSSNSPAFNVNASAINAKSGISPTFSFVPDPSRTYELVFFNDNRSLWHTNSTAAFHIIADITLNYSETSDRALIYPGIALIAVAVALFLVRRRFAG